MGQKAKAKEKKVKDEKFNFSEEVIIGLKRIDDTPVESKKNIKKQKKKPNNINRNEKPKVQVNKKNTKKRKNVRNKQKKRK